MTIVNGFAAKKQLLDRPKTRQIASGRMKNTARVLGANRYLVG